METWEEGVPTTALREISVLKEVSITSWNGKSVRLVVRALCHSTKLLARVLQVQHVNVVTLEDVFVTPNHHLCVRSFCLSLYAGQLIVFDVRMQIPGLRAA